MELYTKYERPPKKLEKGGGKVVVERAGYIPAKDRIEAMIMAGRRLVDSRIEAYHAKNPEDIPEDFEDPTVSPAFDEFAAADAEMYIRRSMNDGIQKATKASLEKKATVVDGDKVNKDAGSEDPHVERK